MSPDRYAAPAEGEEFEMQRSNKELNRSSDEEMRMRRRSECGLTGLNKAGFSKRDV